MRDLKKLMVAIQNTCPDTLSSGDLVHKTEVKEELAEIRSRSKTLNHLLKYKSADDLFMGEGLYFARRMRMESEFGKTSADRIRAASEGLNRGVGKPIERTMNLNLDVQTMAQVELNQKIEELMVELGHKKARRGATQVIISAEGKSGEGQTSELPTQPGVPNSVL